MKAEFFFCKVGCLLTHQLCISPMNSFFVLIEIYQFLPLQWLIWVCIPRKVLPRGENAQAFPSIDASKASTVFSFFSEKSTLQSFGESLVSERFLTFCDSCICKDLFKLTEIAPPEVVSLWKLLRFGGFFGQKLHLIQKTFALFEAFFVSVFFFTLFDYFDQGLHIFVFKGSEFLEIFHLHLNPH